MLSNLEKKIIALLQGDLPIVRHPFRAIAEHLGIEENRLLQILQDLSRRGIIRRFGATLRHQKSGFEANAMVAWQVDASRVEEVGEKMAEFSQVTHCYHRNPNHRWPYNLYTMIHAGDEESCVDTARRISEATGVETYTLLFSRRELKKTSMAYFTPRHEDHIPVPK
jgi:DNA-binding Lrp family transcriptional regulator